MPNILILGAPGYLGLPLCLSLLRTGSHTVYGLARSPARAQQLALNEVIPIEADASDPSSWSPTLASRAIDVVIDCATAYESAPTILSTVLAEQKRRLEALAAEGKVGPKIGLVYVSGTWVHGNPSRQESDRDVVGSKLASGSPARVTGWRADHEQKILAVRGEIDVAIVRPAVILGRGSWIMDGFWGKIRKAAKEGAKEAVVALDAGAMPNVVHVDDVADAMVRVVERIGLLGEWPVFDIVGERVDMSALLQGAGKVLGWEGEIEFSGSDSNMFFEAMSQKHWEDSERARLLLG